MSNDDKIISKIEIDEETKEPIIVQVDSETLITEEIKEEQITSDSNKDCKKSTVNQLEMNDDFIVPENEDRKIKKRQKVFKLVTTILFVIIVVGVLVYTFYNDFLKPGNTFPSWSELSSIFSVSWHYIIYAFIALGFCYLLKGLKLSLMCKSLTGKAHFKTCMETGVIGHYMNNVTPLAVGGQPFEIKHLAKNGVNGGVAAALPIATFFLNQFAFVVLGIVSLILFGCNALGLDQTFLTAFAPYSTTFTVLASVGLALCFAMPFMVVLFSMMPKVGATLVHFVMFLGGKLRLVKKPKETTMRIVKNVVTNSKCLKKVATNPGVFILSFIMSLGEHIAFSSIAYFSLRFFGFELIGVGGFKEWLQILHLCFILYASVSFVPTPGNAGAADLSFFLLFETGLLSGMAFPAMMTWRIVSFYSFIIIGFIFATVNKRKAKRQSALIK